MVGCNRWSRGLFNLASASRPHAPRVALLSLMQTDTEQRGASGLVQLCEGPHVCCQGASIMTFHFTSSPTETYYAVTGIKLFRQM